MDEIHLRQAIERKYEFSSEESRIYAEKMFQMTFYIPQKAPDDVSKFLATQLESLGAPMSEHALLDAMARRYGRNLRQLKVFVNNYTLHRRLFASAQSYDHQV